MQKELKQYTISVTQKHIDDAKKIVNFRDEEKKFCPIALALYEQVVGKEYFIKYHKDLRRHYVRFGEEKYGGSQPFSVAETIRYDVPYSVYKWWGQHDVKHTVKTERFVIDFDKGNPVEPFKFRIKLPK